MSEKDEAVGELDLPLPVNHSSVPKFINLHFLFSRLASIHGHKSVDRRRETVSAFLSQWRVRVGNDFYPFVRLWFTEEDEQLKQLRKIRDTMVAKLLVEALDLPAKSPDAIMLLDTRKTSQLSKRFHDDGLSAKAKYAIEQRYPQAAVSDWTIDAVADKLVLFASANKADRVQILKEFLNTMNADEMYWLIRIILGNVSLNCSVRTLLSILHPDALKVYLVNKNLKMVCQQLWSHDFQVDEVDKHVHLLSHFSPMKAKFVKGSAEHIESVVDLMKPKQSSGDQAESGSERELEFYIEEKMDGERIQLHWERSSNNLCLFSRNGKDHTMAYQGIFMGKTVEEYYDYNSDHHNSQEDEQQHDLESADGNTSFSMQDIVADDITSCIIDGEVVAWDPETNDLCGQSKVRELTTLHKGSRYRHMLLVFDVVYVNGKDLTDLPLRTRKERLEELFPKEKRGAGLGRVQILPYVIGHTVEDVSREFNRIVDQASEGLVVKNMDSKYEIDGRSNSWLKVKPEFVDGYQGENLDLVVVGCYWGSGKYEGKFASYLCALKDETKENRYVALSRIGSGICLAMYEYINDEIEAYRFASKDVPEWLELGNEKAPAFYIHPEKSVVFEVKYSMVTSAKDKLSKSSGYGVGYSLRFPRYVKLREDKDAQSSLTIRDFIVLQDTNPLQNQARKKERPNGGLGGSKRIRLNDGVNAKDIPQKSQTFANALFYLCGDISDPQYMTVSDLTTFIKEHGGRVARSYEAEAIPIADRKLPSTIKLLSNHVDILHPRYLFDSVANYRMLDPEPTHYLGAAPRAALERETVDRFGFSLQRMQTKEEIKRIVYSIDPQSLSVSQADINHAIHEVFACPEMKELRSFLFFGMRVYVSASQDYSVDLATRKLRYGGARIVNNLEAATHVLRNEPSDAEQHESLPAVVTASLIHKSWEEKTRITNT